MSSSLAYYTVLIQHFSPCDGERIVTSTDIEGIYPSLAAANAAAWNEFAGRVNEVHDFGWPKDHPPAGEAGSGKNEGAVIFEGDQHFAWRVGKPGDREWRDDYGYLTVATEGGWHFAVTDVFHSVGFEAVVKKSELHGSESEEEKSDEEVAVKREEDVKDEEDVNKVDAIAEGASSSKKRKV